MNYEPQTRQPRGVDPQVRKLGGRCDVCGKSRAHFKHEKCARARQAAGFKIVKGPAADAKVTCVQCHRIHRYDAMMGNTCRECYVLVLSGEVDRG